MNYFINKCLRQILIYTLFCMTYFSSETKVNAQENQSEKHSYVSSAKSEKIKISKKHNSRFHKLGKAFSKRKFKKAHKTILSLRTENDLSRYEKAVLSNYEGNIYYEQGDVSKALTKFEEVIESPVGLPRDFYNRLTFVVAKLFFQEKKYDLAINAVVETIDELKPNADLSALLGASHFWLGNYDESKLNVDESLKLAILSGNVPKVGWFLTGVCNAVLRNNLAQSQTYLKELNKHYSDQRYLDAEHYLSKVVVSKDISLSSNLSQNEMFSYCYEDKLK